ncbi:hypothetical protein [Bosea sp. ANAM02]|uniref:hypothetical protein n=1 Tax=Bosea sp. ANAM02 TaxID=2020412 RepID=UPI00140EA5B7|nr:hypothetical protein [Bosea sp. ANAM02]BCB18309.1 hypothetical protein OCUBac02_12030 [Bosea sp. ANAM02]
MPYIEMPHSTPERGAFLYVPPDHEPTDDLSRSIRAYIQRVKANGGDFMNLPPLPRAPFTGMPVPGNPFHPVVQSMKPRHPILTGPDVADLYGAVSFCMRHYGVVMNAHMTILWERMGVRDHAAATRVLTLFNHEVGKWLDIGDATDRSRMRFTKRSRVMSSQHFYIYVHENGRNQGFHTHELAFIPPEKAEAFKVWAPRCLARLTKRGWIPPEAFVVKINKSRSESDQVARCWAWFRYVTKSLGEDDRFRLDDGRWIEARAVFKSNPFILKSPVHCAQLASGSRNIWTKAQRAVRFRSRFLDDDELDRLYDGSELERRRREIEEAEDEAARLSLLNSLDA